MTEKPTENRRDFFRSAARLVLTATAGGAAILITGRGIDEPCAGRAGCKTCSALARCRTPEARAERRMREEL